MAEIDNLGKYRIEAILGRGAMGLIYRASEHHSGNSVALKTIRTDLLSEEERPSAVARLRREAEIGMQLNHPGVVKVFDFLAVEDTVVLAMELVDGNDLGRYTGGAGMEWSLAVAVVRELLEALAYVHRRSIIHRDVKPSNIILLGNGAGRLSKLTDFGVAHVASSAMTQLGDIVGTPAYMSPEQLQGAGLDARSDLFGAGATLYALLAGRSPFSGSLAAVMHQILYVQPDPPSTIVARVPSALDEVVGRAMEKNPGDRYGSAEEFLFALDKMAGAAQAVSAGAGAGKDAAPVVADVQAASGVSAVFDALASLLDTAVRERATEKILDKVRALAAGLTAASLAPEWRARIIDLCIRRGLALLADVSLAGAPLPGVRHRPARSDFVTVLSLMEVCRKLVRALDPRAAADGPVKRVAIELQQAATCFSSSLSEMLSGEDNPDIAAISADFMRLDVLQHGLEILGAEEERQSLAATEAILVNHVMTKVNATVRHYTQTGDMLARFGVAALLTEIEELIVLAERLVERPSGTAAAFEAVGRQTLAEFIRNAGILAQMTVDELLREPSTVDRDARMFSGRIKQVGFIYLFATRVDDAGCRPLLRQLSEDVHALMKRLAGEAISRLKAALTTNDLPEVQASAARLAALHELSRELGWHELSRQLLAELRNRVIGEPSLRQLFAR